jgi:putative membrane protein
VLYGAGVIRLWRQAGRGRGARRRQLCCFAGGWALLALALLSPLHELGEHLFTAHMIEHELLMVAAAPLLVLSRPLGAIIWAFPPAGRRFLGQAGRWPALRFVWHGLTEPASATVLHGAAIWFWHMPPLFDAALENEAVHWLQHFSFLGSALLFWWAVLNGRARRKGYGMSVFYLFFTSMHCGLLGAILALSTKVIFAQQNSAAAEWGLSALKDQQLGGLVMWVAAAAFYMVAALVLAGLWITSTSEIDKKSISGAA